MQIFQTLLYQPLYNALIGLIDIIPGGSVGLAIIILTVFVKLVLFPLSASSIRTQIKIKEISGDLKKIKEDYKDNREEMGKKMLELYRENKINPFAGIILILIQLPVIIALYFVFSHAGFPDINTDILYSFITEPSIIKTNFLGFIELTKNKNILVASIAGVTQYFQMSLMLKATQSVENKNKEDENMMEEMMKRMQTQMKFLMPLITFGISVGFVSVIGLYWIVSNVFAIFQEIYIQKKIRNPLMTQE